MNVSFSLTFFVAAICTVNRLLLTLQAKFFKHTSNWLNLSRQASIKYCSLTIETKSRTLSSNIFSKNVSCNCL